MLTLDIRLRTSVGGDSQTAAVVAAIAGDIFFKERVGIQELFPGGRPVVLLVVLVDVVGSRLFFFFLTCATVGAIRRYILYRGCRLWWESRILKFFEGGGKDR